ncbi:MAG TPA: ABC transporter ATP-binding protein [Bacteroidia bacterium]
MSESTYSFQLKNVSIGYHRAALLENISINLQAPCLIGLIGNNGCGKTTLLKTISGLQKELAGTIHYKEKEISTLHNKERSKIISFGFAYNSIIFPISVFELVGMGRYPYLNNMASLQPTDNQLILEAINRLGIIHLKDKLITAISDGERQKAYIAKAFAQQTPILLLDEPTAFLDYTSKKNFFKTIKENTLKEDKITIISSHDIDFLTRNADYLLMIQDDRKVEFDKTETIAKTSYFNTHFNY